MKIILPTIVSHSAAGSMEADKLGLPTVSVTLMPEAIPIQDPKDSFLKRMLMGVTGAGMGLVMTRPLDRIRKSSISTSSVIAPSTPAACRQR